MNNLRKITLSAAFACLLFLMPSTQASAEAEEVTMQSLLREMVNREKLAEFPAIPFRSLQASSYNRASVSPDKPGWFEDSDGVFCIREEINRKGETEWVLMEDNGPGAITRIWAVCFYYDLDDREGANVKIYLDGEDEPAIDCNFFALVQGRAFVKPPLAAETTRAGDIYLPIPYSKGCKVTMDKKVFYNAISYRSYPEGTPVRTFSMDEYYASMSLVDSVNNVLAAGCTPSAGDVHKKQTLKPGQSMSVNLRRGGAIKMMNISLDASDKTQALRSTVLKASFDGEQTVWSPVGDFFNIGPGYKTYSMWERTVEEDGKMICRWVMPYRKSAVLTFQNLGGQDVTVDLGLQTEPYTWTPQSMHFHASWRMDDPTPTLPLFDYNLVEVDGTGVYVGDQLTVLNPSEGWWGEGDEKVYVDDDTFPSQFGTGTEDYYGWAGGIVPNPDDEFSVPFLANVRVASPNSMGYNTCSRTRVLDAVLFRKHLNFNIESSCGTRRSWFHLQYAVSSFWYAKPGAVSNRGPLPEMAARKLMTLEELQQLNEQAKRRLCVAQIPGLPALNPDSAVLTIPAGEFGLKETIHLDGISNLTIEGAPGAATIFSGDETVTEWHPDPEREGVLVADISDMTDLGAAAQNENRIDFYCDGRRQIPARWPNGSFTKAGRAIGATDMEETWIHVHGTKEGVFEYVDDHIALWAEEKDPYLHGYWYWDWAEERCPLGSVDTLGKVITMAPPYHSWGYRDSLRFYGFNLLCELDAPGEYYIDREAHKLYWKPCEGYKEGSSRTSLSVFNKPAAIVLTNCRNVTLRNITLRGLRGKGIVVNGGEGVVLENCRLTAMADDAVSISGGAGHIIRGCHLSELGCGGIDARGGNRATLEPSCLVISDNIVENFSLYKRTYEPAVHFTGAGADILHNRFQGSSSSALRLEGNDINVEYNQFFDLVCESDDQGGMDTFYDYSYRRINIRHNHWRDIVGGMFAGAAAVRFDDIISGHSVSGNIFENCGGGNFGAVQINGGIDIVIEGNVFYGCQAAASAGVWDDEVWEEKYNDPSHLDKLNAVGFPGELYPSRYPELLRPPVPTLGRNSLTHNLAVNFKQFIICGEEGFTCSENTLIKESEYPLSRYLAPEVLASYGIPPIPFEEIGPRQNSF